MDRKALLTAAVLALAVFGCGPEGGGQDDAAAPGETAGGRTVVEETRALEETTAVDAAEQTVPEVVSVGGFSVEDPGGGEITVPQVTAEREEVQTYREQVQPAIEGTVQDVSDLVRGDVQFEDGNLSLDVEVTSLEEARASVRDGLEQLREVDPPEDLEPIHRRLTEAYEQSLPAYDAIVEAAESGDPQRVSAAVRDNLPRIEQFNEISRAIVQDLEQAAESQQR